MTQFLGGSPLISDFEWTLDRYHGAIANGTFTPEDKLELLNGKLIKKLSINPPHAACVTKVTKFFTRFYFDVFELRAENPVTFLDNSEPEPDFAVWDLSADEYNEHHPTPEQVHLLVEVADKSLTRDRTHKASIYAFAGIKEYWIVNLKQEQVELHLEPDVNDGSYGSIVRYKIGSVYTSPFIGEVKVNDLLPGR